MPEQRSLIAELEDAIQSGSKDRRVDTLRRVTDLFVADADRFNDQQIEVFDDVLGHLIKRIEAKALAELSQRLGPIGNAPAEVVKRLARDDDITVAEPVLRQSRRLSDSDLIEIASTKPQTHLLAISARPQIGENVTDVLLQRGDRHVFHKLAGNTGASFSENGFAVLVKHSEGDAHLAEKVGLRLDVPLRLFRELLLRATEAVRSRLLALASPETRGNIQSILAAIAEDVQHEAGFTNEHDFAGAQARVLEMRSTGDLGEAAIFEFARAGRYAELIAALALLCDVPVPLVENLVQSEHREAFLIPCRAAGIEWPTVRAILNSRGVSRVGTDPEMETMRTEYLKLSRPTAGRVLRFWQVRQSATKGVVPAGAPAAGAMPKSLH